HLHQYISTFPSRLSSALEMIRRIAASLLPIIIIIVGVAACTARGQSDLGQTSGADLQKLDASLAFLRARNARDYATASPTGVDRSEEHTSELQSPDHLVC